MSKYRIYVAKSHLVPGVYLGINIPFVVILLLPASTALSFSIVFLFITSVSAVIYQLLKTQLVSDQYLVVDETAGQLIIENGVVLGAISAFSIITSWFIYIQFEKKSYRKNKLVFLKSLNSRDKKRLLRAVYNRSN